MQSISHYTVQRVVDVGANVDGRDLGAWRPTSRRRSTSRQRPAAAVKITLRGQNQVMQPSFRSWPRV